MSGQTNEVHKVDGRKLLIKYMRAGTVFGTVTSDRHGI